MIVASDLEGTLTTGATWRGFGEYLRRHRSALAYNLFFLRMLPGALLTRAGLKDMQTMKNNWIKQELKLFTNATADDMRHMAEWLVEREMWPQRREAVLRELAQHRAAGHRVIVATGTYQPVAEAFARRIDAEAIATPIDYNQQGIVSGISAAVSVRQHKAHNLSAYIDGAGLHTAYGDTASDIAMLEMAANPVAVYPDDTLRAHAEAQGWRIIEA